MAGRCPRELTLDVSGGYAGAGGDGDGVRIALMLALEAGDDGLGEERLAGACSSTPVGRA